MTDAGVLVRGVDGSGSDCVEVALEHGADPRAVLADAGWEVVSLVSIGRQPGARSSWTSGCAVAGLTPRPRRSPRASRSARPRPRGRCASSGWRPTPWCAASAGCC
ncbi:hypothetical protein [Barrientosiimonas endolithica]|uniref:hypothetical protein n=1 Tax=Barrientosiimonas endolithica TaxID=1535208 RepID=UPI00259BD3C6|nr:hypothetical protein [Barrientosiimonas endolithica]